MFGTTPTPTTTTSASTVVPSEQHDAGDAAAPIVDEGVHAARQAKVDAVVAVQVRADRAHAIAEHTLQRHLERFEQA